MNTWFEVVLPGDDSENLQALGEAVLDEIQRVEKLLSRFDPASEVSRINREAGQGSVLVDIEMAEVLDTCLHASQQTDGFFDITANCENENNFGDVEFSFSERLIAFRNPRVRLDFGGFGKGYALDCAGSFLRDYGVKKALLHGGTSSVLAIGTDADENPWRVGLRYFENRSDEAAQIHLQDQALSSSATGEGVSDVVNPHERKPIQEQATCSVIMKSAAQAEIFSTAFLCMGKQKIDLFLSRNTGLDLKVLWNGSGTSKHYDRK